MIRYIKEEALVSSTQDAYHHLDSFGDGFSRPPPPIPPQPKTLSSSIRDPRLEAHLNRERQKNCSSHYSPSSYYHPSKPSVISPPSPPSPPPPPPSSHPHSHPPIPNNSPHHHRSNNQSSSYKDWSSKEPPPIRPSPPEKGFFPWEADFKLRSRAAIGKSSGKHLEELMTWYSRSISSSLQEGYTKPKVAALLKNDINNALMFFHLYHSDIRKPLEHSCYLDKMVDLIAIYLDLEIKASLFSSEKITQTKLTQTLYVFLDHSIDHILDALLKTKLLIKKYVDLCYPIMCRVLCDPPQTPMYNFSYIRYILAFKIWKKLVKTKEEKIKINKMAVSRLQTPRDFLSRVEDIPNVFPKIPKKMKDVTLYLLQCEFDILKSVQAFIKFARDPKNIEFDGSFPKIIQPLFSMEEAAFNGFSNIFDLSEIEKQLKSRTSPVEDKSLDSFLHSTVRSPIQESVPNSSFHVTTDFVSSRNSNSSSPRDPDATFSPSSHSSKSSPSNSLSSPTSGPPSSCSSYKTVSAVSSSLQDRLPSIVTSSSQFNNVEYSKESSGSHAFDSNNTTKFSPIKITKISNGGDATASHQTTTTTVHKSPVYSPKYPNSKSSNHHHSRPLNPHQESHKPRDSDCANSSENANDPRSKGHLSSSHYEANIRSIKDMSGHRSISNHAYSDEKFERSAIMCKVKLEKGPSNLYSSDINNEVSSSDHINLVKIKQEKVDSDTASNPEGEEENHPISHKVTTSGKERSPENGSWSTPIKTDKTVIFPDNNSLIRSIWNCGEKGFDLGSDEQRRPIERPFPSNVHPHEEPPNGETASNLNPTPEDPFFPDICDQIFMGSSCYPESLMQFSSLGFDSERNFGDPINSSGESSSQSGILWSFNDHKQLYRSSSPTSRPYPSQNHARTGEFLFNEHRQEAKIMRGMVPSDVSTLHAKTVVKDYEHFIDQQKYMNTYFNPKNGYRIEFGSEIPLPPPIKTEQRCGCGVCRNNYLYIVGNHQNLADYRKSQLKHAEEVRRYKNDEACKNDEVLQEKLENSSPSTSSDTEVEKVEKPAIPVRVDLKVKSALPLKKRFIAAASAANETASYSASLQGAPSDISGPSNKQMTNVTIEHESSSSKSSTVIRISQKDNSAQSNQINDRSRSNSDDLKSKILKSAKDESNKAVENLSRSKTGKKESSSAPNRKDDLLAAESLISFAQTSLNYGKSPKKEKTDSRENKAAKRNTPSVSVNSIHFSQPAATTVIVNIGNNSNKKASSSNKEKEKKAKKTSSKRKNTEETCAKTPRPKRRK